MLQIMLETEQLRKNNPSETKKKKKPQNKNNWEKEGIKVSWVKGEYTRLQLGGECDDATVLKSRQADRALRV